MINDEFYTVDYWDRIFVKLGFRIHQSGNSYASWESERFMVNVFEYTRGIEYQWVIKGKSERKLFVTQAVKVYWGEPEAEQRFEEMLLMIDVVSDPSKAPLLAAVDWAGGIMERILLKLSEWGYE